LAPRLPCLATGTPHAATTKEATVEMLKVPEPSPPVPQVSTAPREARGTARERIVRAKPTTSSSVSPRTAMAASRAPMWAGVAWPSMMTPMAAAASSSVRRSPRETLARKSFTGAPCPFPFPSHHEERRSSPSLQEIPQQALADRGENTLRVELHALHP